MAFRSSSKRNDVEKKSSAGRPARAAESSTEILPVGAMQAKADSTEGFVMPPQAVPSGRGWPPGDNETVGSVSPDVAENSALWLKVGWQVVFFVRHEPLVAAAVFGRCGRRGRLFRVAFTNL